jgi:hypothetical protein
MHYVITSDGRAVDPIVIDSSGGAGFEGAARAATAEWRFETPSPATEFPNHMVDIRSEIRLGRDAASSNFMRRYKSIIRSLYDEENEEARLQVDDAYRIGGWNLYESTMLWLMMGRVEGAEGNLAGKLECYRRALGVSNGRSLKRKDRIELLEKIFGLEDEFGQHASAMRTYRLLEAVLDGRSPGADLKARAAEIKALLARDDPVTARARIYNPCNCDAGEPLWYYRPTRRTFSFANLNGNVTRFEARCDNARTRESVQAGKSWTLPAEWGSCRIFVFGDDDAEFDFVEHATDSPDDKQLAMAGEHVLDRRN